MNLLLTGAWAGAREHIAQLEAVGHSVAFMQQEADVLPCEPEWVEGVVCNGLFQHYDIAQFKNLHYIQLTSAGLDRVPVDYIQQAGITLYNARGVYSVPMAEFALAGVLALYKQLPTFVRQQDSLVWEKHRDLQELAGKGVCIVGCGSVGTECAKRFAAMGAEVVGVNRTARPHPESCYNAIYGMSMIDDVASTCDVVILALPLTAETQGLMSSEHLAALKPSVILVNLARGGLVDEAVLIDALREGRIGGAVLDVFGEEPLSAHNPLWDLPNVLITPHNSFVGEGNAQRLDALVMGNLRSAGWPND